MGSIRAVIDSVLAGLPVLIVHFGVTVLGFAVWLAIYLWLTPYRELTLVRQGNMAAAVTLSGAALSLALPLAACLAKSVSVPDIFAWGTIAVVLQLLTLGIVNLAMRGLPASIERGEVPPALVLAAIQLSIAAINAAAISG